MTSPHVWPASRGAPAGAGPCRTVPCWAQRDRFFDHLLRMADSCRSEVDAVLRRQAIYLLGFDGRDATVRWLGDEQRAAVHAVECSASVPSWVSVRSSAVALAQDGDRDPLERFVTRGLVEERQEMANLNYWAYWVGVVAEIDGDAVGLAGFAFELGVLKRLRRTGWSHAGIRDAESVAEHSLRVAQLAALIAAEEGADPARAALLAVWHDSQETHTGDLPHTARPYLAGRVDAEAVTADQVQRLPEAAAKTVRVAVAEYASQASPEARCARDADKLECLLQAVEYRAAGNAGVEGWITSSREALRTDTAIRIADAAVRTSPLAWRDR